MKIISIDIRGLNCKIKQKRVTLLMNKLSPDVLMIQETHIRNNSDSILNIKKFPFNTMLQEVQNQEAHPY